MTDFHGDDMLNEEAFIATSFIQFHTEDPGDGSYIPMTEDEAAERWRKWLAEYTRQQREEAWDERDKARAHYLGPEGGHWEDCMGWEDCDCAEYPNPYREDTP